MKLTAKVFVFFVVFGLTLAAVTGCEKKEEEETTGADQGMTGQTMDPMGTMGDMGGNPVWVKVNDEEIHRSRVMEEMERVKREVSGQMDPSQMQQMEPMIKYMAMQRVVDREVLEQAVEEQDVQADPEAVQAEIDKLKSQYPSEEMFQQFLAQAGVSEDDFKQEIQNIVKFNAYIEGKVEAEQPTEQEIQEVYEANKEMLKEPEQAEVQQIYFATSPGAGEAEKQEKLAAAKEAAEKAQGGAQFDTLVQEYSDSPEKAEGGKKTYPKGQMPGDFDEVVFAMEAGQVSEPIETPMGYYVVKVVEIKDERTIPLEEVKEDISNYLLEEKKKREVYTVIQQLKEEADIEWLEPLPQVPGMGGHPPMAPPPEGAPAEPPPPPPAPTTPAE